MRRTVLTRSDTPGSGVGHVLDDLSLPCVAGACRGSLGGMDSQLIEPPDLEQEYPRAKVWFSFGPDEAPPATGVVLELEGSTDPFDSTSRMWHVHQVAVTAQVPGWSVSAVTLRQVKLGELATEAVQIIEGGAARFIQEHADEIALAGRIGGKEEKTFRLVGGVYEDELRRGGKPVQMVADAFGVSRGTATRWVRKARDLGYIAALESERTAGK